MGIRETKNVFLGLNKFIFFSLWMTKRNNAFMIWPKKIKADTTMKCWVTLDQKLPGQENVVNVRIQMHQKELCKCSSWFLISH